MSLGLALKLANATLFKGVGRHDFRNGMPAEATYTRTGAATALTLAGLIQSFAADAPQRTDRGLALEPAATNLLPDGEQPEDTTYWIHDGATFVGSVWDGNGQVISLTASVAATRYTGSVEIVAGTATTVRVSLYSPNGGGGIQRNGLAVLDLTTGALLVTPDFDGAFTASVDAVAGGYRAHVSGDALAGPIYIFLGNANGTLTPGRAQINAGGPTSYIPTTNAAATRGLPVFTEPVPSGRTKALLTYADASTTLVTGLTPGGTFDVVTAVIGASKGASGTTELITRAWQS